MKTKNSVTQSTFFHGIKFSQFFKCNIFLFIVEKVNQDQQWNLRIQAVIMMISVLLTNQNKVLVQLIDCTFRQLH